MYSVRFVCTVAGHSGTPLGASVAENIATISDVVRMTSVPLTCNGAASPTWKRVLDKQRKQTLVNLESSLLVVVYWWVLLALSAIKKGRYTEPKYLLQDPAGQNQNEHHE